MKYYRAPSSRFLLDGGAAGLAFLAVAAAHRTWLESTL
jgi:hypothetical protein